MTTDTISYPIARKNHTCTGCKGTINKGEQYEKTKAACFNEEDIDHAFYTFKLCQKCLKEAAAEQAEMQREYKEREKECEINGHNFEADMVYSYDAYGVGNPNYSNGNFCTNCGKKQVAITT